MMQGGLCQNGPSMPGQPARPTVSGRPAGQIQRWKNSMPSALACIPLESFPGSTGTDQCTTPEDRELPSSPRQRGDAEQRTTAAARPRTAGPQGRIRPHKALLQSNAPVRRTIPGFLDTDDRSKDRGRHEDAYETASSDGPHVRYLLCHAQMADHGIMEKANPSFASP